MHNLCGKLDAMQIDINLQRLRIRDSGQTVKAIQDGVHKCAHSAQNYRELKETLLKLASTNLRAGGKAHGLGTTNESSQQYGHLQNSINELKKNLQFVNEAYEGEKKRVMGTNGELIKEISDLRDRRKTLANTRKQHQLLVQKSPLKVHRRDSARPSIIEAQKSQIKSLRSKLNELEKLRLQANGPFPLLNLK